MFNCFTCIYDNYILVYMIIYVYIIIYIYFAVECDSDYICADISAVTI